MSLTAFVLLAQLAAAPAVRQPVLVFPEAGMDDTVAYAGYRTRFFRDADRNTLQIYHDQREGRLVHLWANGENESVGLSIRDDAGAPAPLRWREDGLQVARRGRRSTASYRITTDRPTLTLGRFVLGSMRIERDVQYQGAHRAPFTDPAFVLPEFDQLASTLAAGPAAARRSALQLLGVRDVAALRARLTPTLSPTRAPGGALTIVQPSLDGLDTLTLTISPEPGTRVVRATATAIELAATDRASLDFRVTISTTGRPLTPLARTDIFTADFLRFADSVRRGPDTTRARWIERQMIGVELLASREKLMAGLPTYATYFGRDMLMSALMMQPIWREQMSEFVIAAALRKLAPNGEVSHEEALGGQAIREAAADYVRLMAEGRSADALAALRTRRVTRENYYMIDDEYQLPIMVARYLTDSRVPAARKRAFLREAVGGEGTRGAPRIARLLAMLQVVATRTAPYAANPTAANLIPFAKRDSVLWASSSWRDSGAGYANGRFAMDVNAIYVPHALAALQQILHELRTLGYTDAALRTIAPTVTAATPLGRYLRDSVALQEAVNAWQGASGHFAVSLTGAQVRERVTARLAAMPDTERTYWSTRLAGGDGAPDTPLSFLALALDASGTPLPVLNSDPATRVFLDGLTGNRASRDDAGAALTRDVSAFVRDYPVGLFLDGVGPVVANDAYATPDVWQRFVADPYHGPRVVWGREVNLFLLGVASALVALPAGSPDAPALREAAQKVRAAVAASGFHSELWSYGFPRGRPSPQRYGSGADVQLWSTTDLAVQYVWGRPGMK